MSRRRSPKPRVVPGDLVTVTRWAGGWPDLATPYTGVAQEPSFLGFTRVDGWLASDWRWPRKAEVAAYQLGLAAQRLDELVVGGL